MLKKSDKHIKRNSDQTTSEYGVIKTENMKKPPPIKSFKNNKYIKRVRALAP